MGSKKTKTTSNQTATTTPQVPDYIQAPIQNYYQTVGGLLAQNPASFVTPVNAIQQQALDQAGQFAQTSPLYGDAAQIIKAAANAAGSAQPLTAPTIAPVAAPTAAQAQIGALPKAAQAAWGGAAPGPAAPLAGAAGAGDIERAQAQSLLTGLNGYQKPHLQAALDATLANYDADAGRRQAAYAAQGAANKAFGGSRFALGEAQLGSDLARQRADLEASARAQAFDRATTLSNLDAARRQEAAQFNAGQANGRDSQNAQLAAQAAIANAGNQNSRDIALASLLGDLAKFNAGQANDLALAQFNAGASAAQFNAGQTNALQAQIYDALQNAAQGNAALSAQTNQFNAQQAAQALSQQLQAAGLLTQTADAQGAAQTQASDQLMKLGELLYALQDKQTHAPLTQAAQIGALLDPALAALLTGQTVTSQGASATKQSGGLLASALNTAIGLGAGALFKK